MYQIILSLNITSLPAIHFNFYFDETILEDTYPGFTKFTLPIYIMYEFDIFSAFFSFSVHC